MLTVGCAADTEPAAAAASVRRVDRGTQQRLLNIRGWRGFNNPWVPVDETDVEYAYINLQQNVERYTGYTVPFFFRARKPCAYAARLFYAVHFTQKPAFAA